MPRRSSMRLVVGLILILVASFLAGCRQREVPPPAVPTAEKQKNGYEAPGTIHYRPEVIEAVAKALVERGFYDPQTKAVYGLALQEGLRRLQREEGLLITGKIDKETLGALNIDVDPDKILLTDRELRALAVRPEPVPRILLDYSTKGPYKAPAGGGIAWEQVIQIKEASAARLYFHELQLGEGHILVIRNARNEVVARYPQSRAEGFWTEFLSPLPLTVQIEAPRGGTGGGVMISRAQIRLKPEAIERDEPVESIIGTDDSVSIGDFPTGSEIYQTGSPVAVLVDSIGEFCTGFLIGPNRLMTNNHCIATQAECDDSLARFNHQNDASGNPLVTTDYDCKELLRTDYTLDYSVLKLEDFPGYEWGYLRLSWDNVYQTEKLTIIGHPAGDPKRVSRTNGAVSEAVIDGRGTDTDIGYTNDTRPGSSGSPVFDLRHYEVVAIHHWGVDPPDHPDNQGVRMRRILADCPVCPQPFATPGRPFDIDEDGREDAFVRSPNWAGVVHSTPTGFETSWIQGGWVGQWNLGVDNWDYTADVDADGDGDIIIRSPEWLGIFKGGPSGLTFEWLTHDWVGNWNLGFDDSAAVGDFNDDGKDDLVLRSDEWIGLLISDGSSLSNPWLQFDWLGNWNLGRPDRFWVGDFTGDDKDDVFVRSPEWAGLFRSKGDSLEEIWMVHDWLGAWNMGDGDEHYVGDFNGDGTDDILTRSNRWISLWISTGSAFDVAWIQHDWVGSWHLGWQDWHRVADFNADGKDDVLIRSNEWIGLLISDGSSLSNPWLQFDWLGQWNLGLPDRESVGDYSGDGKADVMVRSPEWIGRFVSNGTSLTNDFIQYDWLGTWNLGGVDRLVGGR